MAGSGSATKMLVTLNGRGDCGENVRAEVFESDPFQLSLANRAGRVVERKRLSRAQYQRFLAEQPPAEIVMEACATAHHWARTARRHGHEPYLLHAQYVRPYVRRNKTDADALLRAPQRS